MTRLAQVVLFPSFGSKDEAPQLRVETAQKSFREILSPPDGDGTSTFSQSLTLSAGQEFLTTMQDKIVSYGGTVSLVKDLAANVAQALTHKEALQTVLAVFRDLSIKKEVNNLNEVITVDFLEQLGDKAMCMIAASLWDPDADKSEAVTDIPIRKVLKDDDEVYQRAIEFCDMLLQDDTDLFSVHSLSFARKGIVDAKAWLNLVKQALTIDFSKMSPVQCRDLLVSFAPFQNIDSAFAISMKRVKGGAELVQKVMGIFLTGEIVDLLFDGCQTDVKDAVD